MRELGLGRGLPPNTRTKKPLASFQGACSVRPKGRGIKSARNMMNLSSISSSTNVNYQTARICLTFQLSFALGLSLQVSNKMALDVPSIFISSARQK